MHLKNPGAVRRTESQRKTCSPLQLKALTDSTQCQAGPTREEKKTKHFFIIMWPLETARGTRHCIWIPKVFCLTDSMAFFVQLQKMHHIVQKNNKKILITTNVGLSSWHEGVEAVRSAAFARYLRRDSE